MFCTHCGAENPLYAKFCFSCGREFSPEIAYPPQPTTKTLPRYSNFVLQVVCGFFFFAGAITDSFQLASLGIHNTRLIWPLAMATAALWFFLAAKRSWTTITAHSVTDEVLAKKHRRTLGAIIVLGVFSVACASLLGWLVGKSRLQLQTLDADLNEYAKLGDDVSRARNNVDKSIESFVTMYQVIEKDTNALQRNTTKLISELTQYDINFPEYHTQTQKSLHNVTITQRRTFLIQKQIAVAKELKSIDPSEQVALWQEKMLPLLNEEDKLDSE